MQEPNWQEFECRDCGYQVARWPPTDEPEFCTICMLIAEHQEDRPAPPDP